MIVLETKELTKQFGGLTAVNAVSMHINEGDIVGLIGPNGAGKDHPGQRHGRVEPADLRSGVHFRRKYYRQDPGGRCAGGGCRAPSRSRSPFQR